MEVVNEPSGFLARAVKTVTTLNNSCLSLLRIGLIDEASESLIDAVDLTRSIRASFNNGPTSCQDQAEESSKMITSLKRHKLRLQAVALQQTSVKLGPPVFSVSTSVEPSLVHRYNLLDNGKGQRLVFVHLDETDAEESYDADLFAILLSILLYNFAVAQLFGFDAKLSADGRDFELARSLVLHRCMRVLVLARDVSEDVFASKLLPELAFNKKAFLIRFLLLRSLTHFSAQLGREHDHKRYFQALLQFSHMVFEMRQILPSITLPPAA